MLSQHVLCDAVIDSAWLKEVIYTTVNHFILLIENGQSTSSSLLLSGKKKSGADNRAALLLSFQRGRGANHFAVSQTHLLIVVEELPAGFTPALQKGGLN